MKSLTRMGAVCTDLGNGGRDRTASLTAADPCLALDHLASLAASARSEPPIGIELSSLSARFSPELRAVP